MVACGPSSRRAAKSTAYDTDIVDPLLERGRLTLNAEVTAESSRRARKSAGSTDEARGLSHATSQKPNAMIDPT
jgi:hypothetical protein